MPSVSSSRSDGHAELAVMSAATFQHVLEALDTLDFIRCIREGLE